MQNGRRRFITIAVLVVGALMLTSLPICAAPFQPGQIFVAYGGSNIGVFADTVSLAGTPVQTLSVSPSSFAISPASLAGGGVALDEFGNMYVTVQNFGGTGNTGVIKVRRDGSIDWEKSSGSDLDYRGIVASASLNRVFIATAGGTGKRGIHVYKADDGSILTDEFFGGTLAFRDLAMDNHGNLYGLRHNEVRRWMKGSFLGEGTFLFTIPTENPRAIVLDEDGNIYITFEDPRVVRKYSPTGTLLATYSTPAGTGSLIGLDYDPGTQRLFASHTGTGIGQILWISKTAPSGTTMTAFGPTGLSGVRWLAVYPTSEPAVVTLLVTGLLILKRRLRRR